MRIINKKYLLIIILIGGILTGVIVLKPNKEVKLDNVILKQEVNNRTFAMYKETDSGYEEYKDTKFPDMYVLNIEKSKCIDNNGKELENVLSYENDKVTITSGNTTYCYLYFDKSLGLEIKEKEPNRLSTDKIRGAMYRFQGQQSDNVNNYICFGTSNKEECKQDTDHYMYRIIGIEAETGRVKVIKKEALNETYQWYDDYDTDIKFPNSNIYKAISGSGFLENTDYVPVDEEKNINWEEKIENNTWTYGDMFCQDSLGANQIGEELYKVETSKKGTNWNVKATAEDENAFKEIVGNDNSPYKGQVFYYIPHSNEKWTNIFEGKVSLMYLNDYYYSVNDTANCEHYNGNYEECKTGWMHLSRNDNENLSEWTMIRFGWSRGDGFYEGQAINSIGSVSNWGLIEYASVRPVFYLASVNELAGGSGKLDDPFIIK